MQQAIPNLPSLQEDKVHATSWGNVVDACIAEMDYHLDTHPLGLFSDFVQYNAASKHYLPVTQRVLERPEDSCFSYNSCRQACCHPHVTISTDGSQILIVFCFLDLMS